MCWLQRGLFPKLFCMRTATKSPNFAANSDDRLSISAIVLNSGSQLQFYAKENRCGRRGDPINISRSGSDHF